MRADTNTYFLRSEVGRIPTWADLFKRGQATLEIGPYREVPAQVRWYEIIKGNRVEIEEPAGVELPQN